VLSVVLGDHQNQQEDLKWAAREAKAEAGAVLIGGDRDARG
jgi:hypothetical protein